MSSHPTHDYNDPSAPPRLCENCRTPLRGPYCSACGQHDFDVHRSFGHLFHEALEHFFHFDGKFFRGIADLLFHPGRLTVAFNAGKRVSQIPPLRFYVFVSLFFFIWVLQTGDSDKVVKLKDGSAVPKPGLVVDGGKVSVDHPDAESAASTKTPVIDTKASGLSYQDGVWKYRSEPGAKEGSEIGAFFADRLNHRREIGEAFLHFIPKMLLVCLPLFALLTRVLFRRSGLVYLQHLVFALHVHTFVYLFWMFTDGWGKIVHLATDTLDDAIAIGAFLYACGYLFLSLKRVFGESGVRTFFKGGLLFLGYWLTLGVAAAATIGIAMFLV